MVNDEKEINLSVLCLEIINELNIGNERKREKQRQLHLQSVLSSLSKEKKRAEKKKTVNLQQIGKEKKTSQRGKPVSDVTTNE